MKIFLKIRNYKCNIIDIRKGIDLGKSNKSKGGMISHYFFFSHRFNFKDFVSNGCHDLAKVIVNISDIDDVIIKNVHYYCIIHNISKYKVTNLLNIAVLKNRG